MSKLGFHPKREHKMYTINNRILMKICGPETGKVRGGWINLHGEDFDESRCLSNDTNKMKYTFFGARKNVTCGENVRRSDRRLVKKLVGNKSITKIKLRWEDCTYMAPGSC
jgi:hypothetical protein